MLDDSNAGQIRFTFLIIVEIASRVRPSKSGVNSRSIFNLTGCGVRADCATRCDDGRNPGRLLFSFDPERVDVQMRFPS